MMISLKTFRNWLSDGQKRALRTIFKAGIFLVPHRGNLEMLAMKHGTDKWGHGFMEHYEKHVAPRRGKRLNLLEIGIGGPGDPSAGGESLRMWEEYFPKGMIHGIDIEDKLSHETNRTRIYTGSQTDVNFLENVAREIGAIDIVIDDGSHANEDVIISFGILFPLLADDGIYVIEDVQTAYWPEYGGAWREGDTTYTSMDFLKALVDGLNYEFIPKHKSSLSDRTIKGVSFHRNIVFIFKGRNAHTLSRHTIRHVEHAEDWQEIARTDDIYEGPKSEPLA